MSLKFDISTFIFIELEPSIQIGFNDTHFVQHDKTRKNGSNSICDFEKVSHPIPISSTEPQK